MITFIGDIHGESGALNHVLRKVPADHYVIQVGDFGLWPTGDGFPMVRPIRSVDFIYGNHEYFPLLRGHTTPTLVAPNCRFIPQGEVLEIDGRRLAFLGGAESIDKAWRRDGVSWFADESITMADLERLYEQVAGRTIDILVAHTPPDFHCRAMVAEDGREYWPHFSASARAVETVWEQLGRPVVVSGHFHPRRQHQVLNSYCLPIAGRLDL